MATNAQNDLHDRYYELMRLQRDVNHTLDVQVAEVTATAKDLQTALNRNIDKWLRHDDDQGLFAAISRAALDASESSEFSRLAAEVSAKMRLKQIAKTYGTPDSFHKIVTDARDELAEREARHEKLTQNIERLEKQLGVFDEHNRKNPAYAVKLSMRKTHENAGMFDRMGSEGLSGAHTLIKQYASAYAVRQSRDYSTPADCFNDMELLEKERDELRGLKPQIKLLQEQHYRQLAEYKEVRDLQETLQDMNIRENSSVPLNDFKTALIQKLDDQGFLKAFARETPAGAGGDMILAAAMARTGQKIAANLTAFQEQVKKTTELLEGPVGSIAKAMRKENALDLMAEDVEAQAVMAGYLGTCAMEAASHLSQFRPDYIEGPQSLARDIQLYLVIKGGVDPAYIHEVCAMDKLLTGHFNVKSYRPQPNFQVVLSEPRLIDRINPDFAGFLKEKSKDDSLGRAGFKAGELRYASFDMLLGRYFSASATSQEMIDALQAEADSIEDMNDKREKLGIDRGGPRLPNDLG
ncbi:MAG: hypothetical protein H6867_08865 [Rhodospirillales bacterium]|nr:hypothetical protein [Rhodospirillales bacterium]MCB9996083.1 hypothetical protein [Rhodospirillales bacterium]